MPTPHPTDQATARAPDRCGQRTREAAMTGRAGVVLDYTPEVVRLRLAVTRLVVQGMSTWVDDDNASLDLVIDDVSARWQEHEAHGGKPGDLEHFWNQYA